MCPCGYGALFPVSLRRHQYEIHVGLIGHKTQLTRRRPYQASTDDRGSASGGGNGDTGCGGASLRAGAGAGSGAIGTGRQAADGNLADDKSEVPPSSSRPSGSDAPATPPASSKSRSTAHSAVESQLRTLLELTRILVPPTDGGGATSDIVPEYLYSSVGLHVRALYEALGDARRAEPLVQLRKRAKTGRFDTVRLRALQRFVLQVCGAGLSETDQEFMFEFLDLWDGTKAGMAEDAGHHRTLRYTFPSLKAFKNALRYDLDATALDAGWKKVRLVECGVVYEAYFMDVLQVIRALIKKKGASIHLWSGVAGPAPPGDKRETPMDGDAFELCEELFMNNREEVACVLGLHVFSDSSQLSWSGGTFLFFCSLGFCHMPPLHVPGGLPIAFHTRSFCRFHQPLTGVLLFDCSASLPWCDALAQPTNCTMFASVWSTTSLTRLSG